MGKPWRNDTLLMQRCALSRRQAQHHLAALNRRFWKQNALLGAIPGLAGILLVIAYGSLLTWQALHRGTMPSPALLVAMFIVPYVTFLAGFFVWLIRHWRQRVLAHIETPLCFRCSYSLEHLSSPASTLQKCPECGYLSPVSPAAAMRP
jgi:hypothetical protein